MACMIASMAHMFGVSEVDMLKNFDYKNTSTRSHHPQELVDVALKLGYALVLIEGEPHIEGEGEIYDLPQGRMAQYLTMYSGLICVNGTHMVFWNHVSQHIWCPNRGDLAASVRSLIDEGLSLRGRIYYFMAAIPAPAANSVPPVHTIEVERKANIRKAGENEVSSTGAQCENEVFSTGAQRGTAEGKVKWSLLAPCVWQQYMQTPARKAVITFLITGRTAELRQLFEHTTLRQLSKHLEAGAERYGAWNWAKGMPVSRILDSLGRHIDADALGEQDEDHYAAILCNVMFLLHTLEFLPEMNDIPGWYVSPW